MTNLASTSIILLLLSSAPVHAATCRDLIGGVQAQVDAAIDRRAADGPWQPESLRALRSHQPTPQSVAAAQGAGSSALIQALEALNRARAADSAGDAGRCRAELSTAQHLIASLP
jgi:hypothetical protein